MKKLITLLLAAMLLFGAVIPASAAAKPALALSLQKYDAASGGYVPAATVLSGDLLLVEVAVEGTIPSIAALRLKLEYNSASFKYVENSAVAGLTEGAPSFTNKVDTQNPAKSYINGYWLHESPSLPLIAENVTGRVATFLFRCTGSTAETNFTLSVTEAYDKFYKAIGFASKTVQAPITINAWVLAAEAKAAFEKLLTVTYPDSKTDIEAADRFYTAFTAAEQLQFKSGYPVLFAAYKDAWTRYYDAAQNAALDEIQKEINAFLKANAEDIAVLKSITPDTLNETNYQSVLDVQSAFQKLSVQAQSRVDSTIKSQLNRLLNLAKNMQILLEDRKLADESVDEFIALYKSLWGLDEATVRKSADSDAFTDMVIAASADYSNLAFDMMSAAAKAKAEPYGKSLEQYLAWVKNQLEQEGAETKILDEVLAFTTKWSKALKLNALTVGLGDESALQYMLEDYETLSAAAKERLVTSKNTAKQLLDMIQGLKETQKETDTEIIVVPDNTPPQTVEVIKEQVVEVPVETVRTKTQVHVREIPLIVKIMALFMCAGLLSLAVPAVMYMVYRKKLSAAERSNAE